MTHFGKVFQNGNSQVVKQFAKLKNKYSNLVLLQKGKNTSDNQHDQFSFIDSLNSISTKDYDIIFRGKTKIGIITYGDGLDPIKNVNDIAIFLKEQKSCNLVVCLSSLGFKSENSFNDLSLAESSTHIDIIAGVHISNYCKQPYISRNKNTYSQNPLACATALAVLDYIEKNDLVRSSERLGAYLLDKLQVLYRHEMVGDVRGIGLFAGVEFVRDRKTKEPFPPARKVNALVSNLAFDNGLIVYPGGGGAEGVNGDHILIAPPFIITEGEIEKLVAILDEAIGETERSLR